MKRVLSIPKALRPATNEAGHPARLGTPGPGPVAVTLPLILALAGGATLGPVPARAQVPGPISSSQAQSGPDLATVNARLRAEIDAIRGEERRRDRRARILDREAEAEQGYRSSDRDYLERSRPDPDLLRLDTEEAIRESRIERRVGQLERDVDDQRDLAAARLGVSREEYEKAMRDRFRDSYYGGGSWK